MRELADIKWGRRAAALSARPGADRAAKRSSRPFVLVTEETALFAQRRGARGEKLFSSSLSAICTNHSFSERFLTTDFTDFTDGKPAASYPGPSVVENLVAAAALRPMRLCASNPARSVFTQREPSIPRSALYEEICPAHASPAPASAPKTCQRSRNQPGKRIEKPGQIRKNPGKSG